MRANRRRDSSMERSVRSLLHRRGLRFRVDHPIRIQGHRPIRADIVFPSQKICVQLDGCWWHGCELCGRRRTSVNPGYWQAKIARNVERDEEQTSTLRAGGWVVLRFWEHEPPDEIAAAVEHEVAAARASAASE